MKHPKAQGVVKFLTYALAIWVWCFSLYWFTGVWVADASELKAIGRPGYAYLFEPLVLSAHFIIIAIITRRISVAVLVVTSMYLVFMLINIEMMNVFRLIFSPSDIKHSLQVLFAKEILLSYWQYFMLFLLVLLATVMLTFRSKQNQLIIKHYKGLMAVLIVLVTVTVVCKSEITDKLEKNFKLRHEAVPHRFAEKHGFLFSFYYQYIKLKEIQQPENYSKQTIKNILSKYQPDQKASLSTKPDVIIFFIEAFADPQQMYIQTNRDPIPHFRKTANQSISGLVISPEIGGRSANPEFELLTGLSMRYVPEKAIPYIDYISSKYPSIADEFKNNGYTTNALHVATLAFFNYTKVYPLLGFDHIETLHGVPNTELDPAGRYPSENALVDRIIDLTESSSEPQFIFAFPNSTHGFWDYKAYLDSDLEVLGDYLDKGKAQLKTYINAIHQADKAIGKLIKHYQESAQPSVILVLGDHQPGLPEFKEKLAEKFIKNQNTEHISLPNNERKRRRQVRKAIKNDDALILQTHQVPYFIWSSESNIDTKQDTSMNLLSIQLARLAGIKLSQFYLLISRLQQEVGALSKLSQISSEHQSLINDYQLIQYDIMYGEQYALAFNRE